MVRLTARRLILALAALTACATPVEQQTWIRVRSAHFEVLSNADPEKAAEVARNLERFQAVVLRLTSANVEASVPTRLFYFRDSGSFRSFQPGIGVAGYLIPTLHGNYIGMDATAIPEAPMELVFHEYVHFLLRNGATIRYPTWFDEGFAEYMCSVAFTEDEVVVGIVPVYRASWLIGQQWLPLEQILSTETIGDKSAHFKSMFYSQAWAFVHYLMLGSELGFPDRSAQLSDYLLRLHQGAPAEAALEQAFEIGPNKLQRELETYMLRAAQRRVPPYRVYEASAFPAELRTSVEPVPAADALAELGQLQLELGRRDPKHYRQAELLFQKALVRDPDRVLARVGRVRAQAAQGAPDIQALQGALAAGSADPRAYLRGAELLLDRARSSWDEWSEPEQRRAVLEIRDLYERALELAPDLPAALAGLGSTHGFPGEDPVPGIRALEQARAQIRWSSLIAFELGRLYARVGGRDRARQLLKEVVHWSHDEAGIQAAQELLAELEEAE